MSSSTFATSMRSHACGELRSSHEGETVRLCGWMASKRDHGGVTFLDLRDRTGIVQLVFHPEDAPEQHAAAQHLGSEDVVRIGGEVRGRPEGMRNPNLDTGDVEVVVTSLELLAEAATPPFPIEDRLEVSEELRLKYRYLDLRRWEMTQMLAARDLMVSTIREYLHERGFVEIETPMLTRSTPEGARDYLVPARLFPGTFYALPQSPQQLKQLLMVAGQDRYFQIARCFRDEASRADRQFEFTQLDLEMSFVDEEDVYGLIEPLFAEILRRVTGATAATPFPRLRYREAMDRYGSDKPDQRYGDQMVIAGLTDVFAATEFRGFRAAVEAGGEIRGFSAPWVDQFSRAEMDKLEERTKGRGAAGLVWLHLAGSEVRGPVAKFLSEAELEETKRRTGAVDDEVMFLVADRRDRVDVALDALRREMADRLGLAKAGEWEYLWITEPPLFEWSEEQQRWTPQHHPFTSPTGEDLAPETATACAYDLVLNGVELGSGSIRINRPELQRKVFEALGLSQGQIDEQFGHLITAFSYGVPPHGGIAPGIDRTLMVLLGKDSLRDVTAFPKAQSGADPLTGAPAPATDEQLRELGIRFAKPPAT